MVDKRRINYSANTFAFVALVFGILVLVNFLSSRRFIRADLTEDKRYTISAATKEVLETLDDIVTITAYFSTSPAQVAQIRQSVRDVLEEYDAFSTKLQIDFVDPANLDAAQKEELNLRGVPELQINVVKQDNAEIARVYMGITVSYSGQEEVLPLVQSTTNLEYDLTAALLKVTTETAKTIGFLAGHGEFDINAQAHQGFRQLLDKNGKGQYTLTTVTLQDGQPIDPNITTLVIAAVKQTLREREIYEIDQFIMRGGRVVFLVDPIQIRPGTLQGGTLRTGLDDILRAYGVDFGNNVLLDPRFHDMVPFQQGFMRVIQPYPYFVKIAKQNFSKEHSITSQLETLTLPWTSSLKVLPREGVTATVLAKTSDAARSIKGYYNLMPGAPIPPDAQAQTYTTAIALEGTFKSFYADREVPPIPEPTPEAGETTPAPLPDTAEQLPLKTGSEPTQIVVVGTAQFLTQLRPDGVDFFLNTVDWLTLGDALIGIRSQTITDRPLREVSEFEKNFIQYLCIIGIPLIVAIVGLLRYLLKRRARRIVDSYQTA